MDQLEWAGFGRLTKKLVRSAPSQMPIPTIHGALLTVGRENEHSRGATKRQNQPNAEQQAGQGHTLLLAESFGQAVQIHDFCRKNAVDRSIQGEAAARLKSVAVTRISLRHPVRKAQYRHHHCQLAIS